MQASVIQRQYDDIIASHYDFDPQSVIGDSLHRAIQQIERHERTAGTRSPLNVLDLGVGTGQFLARLRTHTGPRLQPFGLDISQKMIDIARTNVPGLAAIRDDAANLDNHFADVSFGLVCTHFITGFVPMSVLAPKILNKLESGGLWSFVGGTQSGFPVLQQKANSKLVKWLFGIKGVEVGEFVCNPADQAEVAGTLQQAGFVVRECATFRPPLHFHDFKDFLEFAYYGGWLTPFVEALGLHRARPLIRAILNQFVFPVHDHHSIVIALAQKP
jgi:SAM-dependent methyltransferase